MNDRTLPDETEWAYRLYDAQKLGLDLYLGDDPKPTRNQVSAVLHAMADHTLLMHAVSRASALGSDRAEYGFQFAQATGLGRFLQQLGNAMEDLAGLDSSRPTAQATPDLPTTERQS